MTLENTIFEMMLKGYTYKTIAAKYPTTPYLVMTGIWRQAKALREYYSPKKIPYCKDVYDLRRHRLYWRRAIYTMESGK